MSRNQYDTFRPSALPSASVGHRPLVRIGGAGGSGGAGTAAAELNRVHDVWNTRIDKETKTMAGGLRELVELADIGTNPAPGAHSLSALHLKLKTSTLIQAAQQLRDTAHELRLALALGDDVGAAARRDTEATALRAEADRLRAEVAQEFGLLVGRAQEDTPPDEAAEASVPHEQGKEGQTTEGAAPDVADTAAAEDPADAMDVDDDEDEDEFEEV